MKSCFFSSNLPPPFHLVRFVHTTSTSSILRLLPRFGPGYLSSLFNNPTTSLSSSPSLLSVVNSTLHPTFHLGRTSSSFSTFLPKNKLNPPFQPRWRTWSTPVTMTLLPTKPKEVTQDMQGKKNEKVFVSYPSPYITVFQLNDPTSISFVRSNKELGVPIPKGLEHLHVDCQVSDPITLHQLQQLAGKLRDDKDVVVMPTETVYGLAGVGTSDDSVRRIYQYKQRPSDNPLILHVSSLQMLHQYWPVSSIPPHVCQLIQRCWPGPLTLLVPLCKNVPMHYCTSSPSPLSTLVTCGLPSVAFRFPRHPLARALIDLTQVPLAAPSANRSGRPSPTCVSHVVHDYQEGPYPLTVLEGGPCEEGLESSIVWVVDEPPLLVRPGPWTFASLRKIPGWHHLQLHPSMRTTMMNVSEEEKEKEEEAQVHDASSSSTQETHFNLIQHKESPSTTLSTPFRSSSPTLLSSSSSSSSSPIAPGMKYKHYSPEVPVHVVTDPDFLPSYLTHLLHGSSPSKRHPKKIGVLLLTSIPSSTMTWLRTPSSMFEVVDHHQTPSQTFFDGLRTLDQPRTLSTLVVVPPPSHHPQAMALWNRLKKAASVWIDRPDTVDLKEEGLRSKDNGWNGSHSK